MTIQKVIKVGNSLAVTLPREFINYQNIQAGQNVFIDVDNDSNLVQIKTKDSATHNITPEFKQWLHEVKEKHSDIIKELAKK